MNSRNLSRFTLYLSVSYATLMTIYLIIGLLNLKAFFKIIDVFFPVLFELLFAGYLVFLIASLLTVIFESLKQRKFKFKKHFWINLLLSIVCIAMPYLLVFAVFLVSAIIYGPL